MRRKQGINEMYRRASIKIQMNRCSWLKRVLLSFTL